MKELAIYIIGGRLRLTAAICDGIAIDHEKLSRFERRVVQVHAPGKRDPEGVIAIRLEKPAPPECNLRRSDRVYVEPSTHEWFALTKDEKKIIFRPELIGVSYPTKRECMEKFGFAIAGEDVRCILFRALYDHGDMPREPLTLIQAVNKKGAVLDAYAKELLEKHTDWFTLEEHNLINEYLGTR